ncbi:transmembrane protein 163-like [Patiria miniata]|uniref:Cation efflux protein transmembrane domain-containing protein n=1 Tax=Patiria miniata TaxID=46514 RepID=A0A913ZCH1_PATMI|nr:transmembrane protein 163-like [Patiria miniata]XP_038048741.1 transmembrane protein 163-like [Patiria miniata]
MASSDRNAEHLPLTPRAVENHTEEAQASSDSLYENDNYHSLSPEQEAHYHRAVLFLAWFSVFALLVLSITSFVISQSSSSVALFGFGLDALLDVGTSLVVVWRFYGSSQTVYSRERERIALLVLAVLFIAASLLVGIRSLVFVIKGSTVEEILALYIVSTIAVVISLMLFLGKMHVGYKLRSKTVISDGYSSLACGIGSLGVIISACIHSKNSNIYYLDDVVGFTMAALLLGYGISLLMSNWQKKESDI